MLRLSLGVTWQTVVLFELHCSLHLFTKTPSKTKFYFFMKIAFLPDEPTGAYCCNVFLSYCQLL